MGLFEHFPYTNMHELNLSWLLSAMKKLQEDYEAFKVQVEDTVEAFRLQMDGWEERIADLEASWAALRSEWVAFQAEISRQMDGWEDRIAGLESAWSAYQSAMDAAFNDFEASVTSLISGWDERISTLETSWTNYQVTIDSAMQSFEESINASMDSFISEIRQLVDGLPDKVAALEADRKVVNISTKFTQDGSLDQFRRSVYRINGITYGTMRFGGYHGTAEIEITVADEAIPAYGSFASYREEPVGTVDISHLIDTGYISSYIPSRKDDSVNGLLPSKPDDFIQPLNTKSGNGFLIRVPNNVRLAMLEYPDCTCIIQFTYVGEDRL